MTYTNDEIAALKLEVANLRLQDRMLELVDENSPTGPAIAKELETWRQEANAFMLGTEAKLRMKVNNQRRELRRLNKQLGAVRAADAIFRNFWKLKEASAQPVLPAHLTEGQVDIRGNAINRSTYGE